MASVGVAGELIRIGIIFGGRGPEHEASLSSAKAVMDGLDGSRYRIEQFGIGKSGEWLSGPSAWYALVRAADPDLLPAAIRNTPQVPFVGKGHLEVSAIPDLQRLSGLDCIFPIVDGVGGEDGSLQGLLSYTGRPIVGSPLLAAAQGYNKWTAKQLAVAVGVPVANGVSAREETGACELCEMVKSKFGHWDLVVKPASCGSSFGVSRIRGEAELQPAVEAALAYDNCVLIEEYIAHTEIFVAILQKRNGLLVAPTASDRPGKEGVSTYKDKYIEIEPSLECPSAIDPRINAEVRAMAVKVFETLGCSGFARLDFFLSSECEKLYFNEVNTMPAMAPYCAFPTAMRVAGLSYTQLMDEIIAYAIGTGVAR